LIKVENVTFSYQRGAKTAVSDLNFQVKKGEIFGFLGPSGAGKSTTQKLLIGLLHGYEGQIYVFNRNLKDWKRDYYEHIGVSFELPYHFNKLTALENLTYFAALYRRKTKKPMELLEKLNLAESANLPVSKFSKGMKNRLSFARALLHNPELLFLDEPTSGLDPVNARLVKDLILSERKNGCTIFLTTHDMTAAAELCDRVSFIVDGKIILIKPPRQLELEYGQATVKVEYFIENKLLYKEFPLAGLGANEEFLSLLRSDNVRSIHSKDATLEEIFIKVTGRNLV
jgi:fluoroquinolone transport system ATP-binding protein